MPTENHPTVDQLSSDALTSTQLETLIHVDELEFYASAPRQLPNPRYQELFASIERHGVDQPFVIGKRPGEDQYTLLAGGTTRLQILKSLHANTGEEKYALARCVKKEWPGELEATLMYLRADDLHGDLTFIERSNAVVDLVARRASELGQKSLSNRRAARELSEVGYSISHQHLSTMRYAVNRLSKLLPKALQGGLGRNAIDDIRTLENTSSRIWKDYSDNDYPFDELFEEHCRRADDEQWSTDLLQMELEDEIAIGCGRDLQWVRMMLDRALQGEEVEFEQEVPPLILPEPVKSEARTAEPEPSSDDESEHVEEIDTEGECESDEKSAGKPGRNPYLKELRAYACSRAVSLSKRVGIEDCVARAFGSHCGFYLIDIPACMNDEKACAVWEFLAVVSAMSEAELRHWKELVPNHARMRESVEHVERDMAGALMGLRLDRLDASVWQELDDEEWADAMGLMDVYRRIRIELKKKDWSVWPSDKNFT